MNWPKEVLNVSPWKESVPPRRILAIRLQAFGDTVITLPWLSGLKEQFPYVKIDFLILEKNAELPRNLALFNTVYGLKGPVARLQFLYANLILPALFFNRYDIVIDLQRNRISRWVRFWLFPASWCEIERFSKSLAGEKFKNAIEAIGFKNIEIPSQLKLKEDPSEQILMSHGWNGVDKLIVLNPAGGFVTRNWPLEYYISFVNDFLERDDPNSKILFLGTDRLMEKAEMISSAVKRGKVINLVNQLTPSESFAVLKRAHLVVTEDSGLMHMAWVQRVPTVALFGASPSYWSSPMGAWTKCLNSSDLACGNCCSDICQFGDVRCLTRFHPGQVFEEAQKLLESLRI